MARKKTLPSPGKTAPRTSTLEKATIVARSLLENNRPQKALDVVESYARYFPKDPELRYLRALCLKAMMKILEASKVLEELILDQPDNLMAISELGTLHARYGNANKAHTLMSRALEIAPQHPQVNFSYGSSCQRHGDLPTAVQFYKKALNLLLQSTEKNTQKKVSRRNNKFDTTAAEALLWRTLEELAHHGVHAFASHGTLLGLVREGALLPFDKDLDIGLPFSELHRATKILAKSGWKAVRGNFGLFNPVAMHHPIEGISLDLCGFAVEKNTGKTIYGFWMKSIPKSWNRIIELDRISLVKKESPNGKTVWAVENPEVIFEPFYGNWKTPDPHFVSIIGEPGLRGLSLLSQCYGLSKIFSSLDSGNTLAARRYVNTLCERLPTDSDIDAIRQKIAIQTQTE